MKRARVDVSQLLLVNALGLPANTIILGAAVHQQTGDVELIVSHPDLVDQPEGGIGVARPQFETDGAGVAVFRGWGQ